MKGRPWPEAGRAAGFGEKLWLRGGLRALPLFAACPGTETFGEPADRTWVRSPDGRAHVPSAFGSRVLGDRQDTEGLVRHVRTDGLMSRCGGSRVLSSVIRSKKLNPRAALSKPFRGLLVRGPQPTPVVAAVDVLKRTRPLGRCKCGTPPWVHQRSIAGASSVGCLCCARTHACRLKGGVGMT